MSVLGSGSKFAHVLLCCCALLLFSGCAAMYGLKEDPKISIADIRIQDVKAMEGIFLIKLRVLNPNDVPLEVHGVTCDLEINSRHFASGIGDSRHTVPAFGTAVVPVEVYASVLDVIASAADLLHTAGKRPGKDQPVPYTLQGTARIGTRGFTREVPFTSAGELSLKGLSQLR